MRSYRDKESSYSDGRCHMKDHNLSLQTHCCLRYFFRDCHRYLRHRPCGGQLRLMEIVNLANNSKDFDRFFINPEYTDEA